MGIWNEIQEQMIELQKLLEKHKQLNNIFNNQLIDQYDRSTDSK